jgi:hypothetical protein
MALTIVTNSVTAIATTTATCGGNSITTPTGTITAKGVCWGITTNPFLTKTNVNWSKSGYIATITSLAHGMSSGTTITISSSSNTTAVPNGNYVISVTNSDTFTITLLTSSTTTGTFSYNIIGNGYTNNGTGNSNFTSSITGLTTGTTYYVRAYVTELVGSTSTTYYGANVVFTTLGLTTIDPDVATPAKTSTTATSGATSINGFTSISAVGVCWNTIGSPTISNNHTSDILIGNTFTSYLTSLIPGTTYYVKSYIISGGTLYYGNEQSFITNSDVPSILTSSNIAIISNTEANVSATLLSFNGSSLTTGRGIEYSLYPNMSSATYVNDGATTLGNYTISLTGLSSTTLYYFRARATNSVGNGYGEIYNFTTAGAIVVNTVVPYSITSSYAYGGCDTILNDNMTEMSGRGVYISTTPNPTSLTSVDYPDSDPGNSNQFIVKFINLIKDTTYYVRAYAITTYGIIYGEELIFSTTSCNPLVEDCNPQEYPVVECSDIACEYIIPAACVIGETMLSQCNIVSSEDPTLLSNLIKINDLLCNIASKDFTFYFLSTVASSSSLSTIFCNVVKECRSITATAVRGDIGATTLLISSISSPGTNLIGRTITSSTSGIFQSNTIILDVETGTINGQAGTYKISKTLLNAAINVSITLTFT